MEIIDVVNADNKKYGFQDGALGDAIHTNLNLNK